MEHVLPRLPLRLFVLGALAGFLAGCAFALLGLVTGRLIIPVLYSRENGEYVTLLLASGSVLGTLIAFPLSFIPRKRVQAVLFLGLWLYAFLMYLIWFDRWWRSFPTEPWEAWVALTASLILQAALTCSFILLPFWFGRVAGSGRHLVLLLAAFPFLGAASAETFYTLWIEPVRTRAEQARLLPYILGITAFLTTAFTYRCMKAQDPDAERSQVASPRFGHYVMWVLLSFAVQGLSITLMNYVSIEVAPFPFFNHFFSLYSSLALVFALMQSRPDAEPETSRLGNRIRWLTLVPIAPYMYVLGEMYLETHLLPNLLILIVAGFALFLIPFRATIWLQLLLLLPALLVVLHPDLRVVSIWSLFLLVAVYWISARGCYGRISELAPGPDHLPHLFLCILVGHVLAFVNVILNLRMSAPWMIEVPMFLVIATLLRLVPCPRITSQKARGEGEPG